MKRKAKKEQQNVESDSSGLKAMASRLRAAVDTANYPKGYPEIKPSVRDSSKLANDILVVVKILRGLAKVDGMATFGDGVLFHAAPFAKDSLHAVFNSRLLASGLKEVLA